LTFNDYTEENSDNTTTESDNDTDENRNADYIHDSDSCVDGCLDGIIVLYILYHLARFIIGLIIKFFKIVFTNKVLLILFILIVICFVLRIVLRD